MCEKQRTLSYGLLANNVNFRGPTVAQFLRTLHAELAAPMTVFWDQIPIHDCAEVGEYLATARDVVIEPFPPYTPELNPADGIWRYIKYGRLANYCPPGLSVLRRKVTTELDRLQGQPDLLKSFVRFQTSSRPVAPAEHPRGETLKSLAHREEGLLRPSTNV
jgi:putative transposase